MRVAGRPPTATVHPTTRVKPPVHTTTNQLSLTAKISPLILIMLDRHTHNIQPSRSRIISRSTVDLPTPFHRRTLAQRLRDHHRTLNPTTRRTTRLPSWRSIRLPRQVLFLCIPSDKLAHAKAVRCSTPIIHSRTAQLGPRRHPLLLHIRARVGHLPTHPFPIPPATRRYPHRRSRRRRHRTTRARNALQCPALAPPHMRILRQRQHRHKMGLRLPQPCRRSNPGEEMPTSLPSVAGAAVVVVAYPIILQVHSRKLLHNIEQLDMGHFSSLLFHFLTVPPPFSLCAAFKLHARMRAVALNILLGVSFPILFRILFGGVFFFFLLFL